MLSEAGGPASWHAPVMQRRSDWVIELSTHHVDELLMALARVERRGLALAGITVEEFALPTLGPLLVGLVDELVDGRGFVLVRGVPVDGLSERQCELVSWGLGQHVGIPVPQNAVGALLVHVRDEGLDYDDPHVRGYLTSAQLDYHVDSSDVVGLLCRRPAKSGGVRTIVSAVAIHDEIVRTRPDLARVLYEPFWFDRRSGDGPESFYAVPVFSRHDGWLVTQYSRAYIESAQRGPHVPALRPDQIEALDLVDSLTRSDDFVLRMEFEPGDVQFLDNYLILHARTDYEDWPEPDRKRDLIRLWLTLRRDLCLPPEIAHSGITPRTAAFQ